MATTHSVGSAGVTDAISEYGLPAISFLALFSANSYQFEKRDSVSKKRFYCMLCCSSRPRSFEPPIKPGERCYSTNIEARLETVTPSAVLQALSANVWLASDLPKK